MPEMFGEDDFNIRMTGEVRQWLDNDVREGYLRSFDGLRIHYYLAVPPQPKGFITVLHGFGEFFGKLHEVCYYFYKAGLAVCFPELRGHGYSGREVRDPDIVHVRSYKEFVLDIKYLMDYVVSPEIRRIAALTGEEKLPSYIYGHSMGGAIASLMLEIFPGYFDKAVLSAPMMMLKKGTTDGFARFVLAILKLIGRWEKAAPSQHPMSMKPDFKSSNCMSEARYYYTFEQRLRDKHYRMHAGSNAWLSASITADRFILRHRRRIDIPVLLLQAGGDRLVDPVGQLAFLRGIRDKKSVKAIRYRHAKHELYSASEDIRKHYFRSIIRFLDS